MAQLKEREFNDALKLIELEKNEKKNTESSY